MTGKIRALAVVAAVFLGSAAFADSSDPMELAGKFFKEKKYDQALEIYSKTIKTYPGSDWEQVSRVMIARIYDAKGDTEKAVDAYKIVITKFKNSSYAEEAYFAVAKMRSKSSDPSAALKAYDAYIKAYPSGQYAAMAYFNAANFYRAEKNYPKALEYYEKILSSYPGEQFFYSWAAIYSGHISFIRSDYDSAIVYYRRVINSENNRFLHTLSSLYIGEAYIEKNDYAAAEGVFQNILKTTRQFSEEALYGLAKAQYKAGRFEMAKETLETIEQLYPDSVWMKEVKNKLKTIEARIKETGKKTVKEN